LATATGPKFYPRVQPGPDPAQTRKVNSAGKKTAEKRTGKLSTLATWEGYRVFQDARSPTGWIDQHRVPIVAVDTNGHALRMNLRNGKPEYVSPTPAGADSGGLLGSISKVLAFTGADLGGLMLELTGNSAINNVRVGTGIAVTGGIVTAGGLGASSVAGLSGGGGLSGLLGGGGFAGVLGSSVSAAGPVPGPSPASQRAAPGDVAQAAAGFLSPAVIVIAGIVLFALASSRKR